MSLVTKLSEERRARLAAERLLELKQAELFAANRKLDRHARKLSEEIVETRAEVATVRDENKRVKSDLSAANQKILIVERRLWHSIETIQDGFAFFDDSDRMIMANPAYLSVFDGLEEVSPGITYPRMLQLMTEEGIIDPGAQSPADWRARMLTRWQSPAPEPVVIRLWNDRFVRLIDRRGNSGDVVSLALDITASVRYESQLKAAQRKAEAANRAKSSFLANMSHEIRTPMNGVVGMAELLAESTLDEEQRLYVETIRNSSEALLVIINDVLDYSKIEAEKLKLHPRPFDLERSIHEVAMLLQPTASAKGIELLIDYDMFLPTRFIGDPGRLRQVLTNLMGNAVKFTAKGHVLVRVVGMAGDCGKTDLRVVVEDTGIGIPPEKIEHIFGEFNQVEDDRNRQFEGTGLGLAITQRLVALMGGEVWVNSEPDRGSCFGFIVTLPADEPICYDIPRLPDSMRRVLIVDDNSTNTALLTRQMAVMGITVHSCQSAAQALDRVGQVDAVVADQALPDKAGIDVIRDLRLAGVQVPALLLAQQAAPLAAEVAGLGRAAVLQKPVSRRQVFAQLAELAAIAPAKPTPRITGSTPAHVPAKPAPDARLDVLLAEDNRTNQLVFGKMVKDMHITLRFANNGEEAVQAVHDQRPDIVFMDISMPRMDGKEATRHIRAAEQGDRLPIIAVTAHAMQGDKDQILQAGLDDYLTKPIRKPEIKRILAEWFPARFGADP
ncbi:response regulator [Mesobacterium sp. TK19101]|uniref:histidine kinase n=1 Tax=Mesobacterium hydrothermale TaxID=3111907 RepID=A0ABU6HBC1_9RHOB|nr:response regulator [Mesobacterium sp. TK19101]MEC3859743.1 response regulator [Mesobacterium sp. TK19101]